MTDQATSDDTAINQIIGTLFPIFDSMKPSFTEQKEILAQANAVVRFVHLAGQDFGQAFIVETTASYGLVPAERAVLLSICVLTEKHRDGTTPTEIAELLRLVQSHTLFAGDEVTANEFNRYDKDMYYLAEAVLGHTVSPIFCVIEAVDTDRIRYRIEAEWADAIYSHPDFG